MGKTRRAEDSGKTRTKRAQTSRVWVRSPLSGSSAAIISATAAIKTICDSGRVGPTCFPGAGCFRSFHRCSGMFFPLSQELEAVGFRSLLLNP